MIYAGKPEEALALSKKALRLSPYPPAWYLTAEGHAYAFTGRYGAAISSYKKVLERTQEGSHAWLARHSIVISYMQLGREA